MLSEKLHRVGGRVARALAFFPRNRVSATKLSRVERKLTAAKQELRRTREALSSLTKAVEALPRYEFGSYTPGVSDWSRRWDDRPDRRVLLFAPRDYAGSFFKWATAINSHTDFAARLVGVRTHRFGYPLDLLFPAFSFSADYSGLLELIEQSSVVHIKDESGFYLRNLPPDLFAQFDGPRVFTHYGTFAREHATDPDYMRHVLSFDARIAMTPDLCFEWFDGAYIPHAVDSDRFEYSWQDGRVLGHSPSDYARKGTNTLLHAIEDLDVRLDLIEGVPHDEALRRKATCNLFFDQAGPESQGESPPATVIGWYGNSAIEAAVHGIPTIAHLSEAAFAGALRAGKPIRERCPIINTPLDEEGMRETIERYFAQSAEDRHELSLRTRAWIEEFHSYPVTGRELAAVYSRLCAKRQAAVTSG